MNFLNKIFDFENIYKTIYSFRYKIFRTNSNLLQEYYKYAFVG